MSQTYNEMQFAPAASSCYHCTTIVLISWESHAYFQGISCIYCGISSRSCLMSHNIHTTLHNPHVIPPICDINHDSWDFPLKSCKFDSSDGSIQWDQGFTAQFTVLSRHTFAADVHCTIWLIIQMWRLQVNINWNEAPYLKWQIACIQCNSKHNKLIINNKISPHPQRHAI